MKVISDIWSNLYRETSKYPLLHALCLENTMRKLYYILDTSYKLLEPNFCRFFANS